MNVRVIREYMRICRFLEVQPTWEGLRKFGLSSDVRRIKNINQLNSKHGGK